MHPPTNRPHTSIIMAFIVVLDIDIFVVAIFTHTSIILAFAVVVVDDDDVVVAIFTLKETIFTQASS